MTVVLGLIIVMTLLWAAAISRLFTLLPSALGKAVLTFVIAAICWTVIMFSQIIHDQRPVTVEVRVTPTTVPARRTVEQSCTVHGPHAHPPSREAAGV